MRWERFPALPWARRRCWRSGRAGCYSAEVRLAMARTVDEVDRWPRYSTRYSCRLAAELKVVAKRFVEARGDKLDMLAWIVAADLTAGRAALTLCGDLGAAARVIAVEPSGQSPLPARERIMTCWRFFGGEDHFAFARRLACT